ncbi:DUF4132 domain-containing protein [Actinoplanes sp. G11-F43]|uniref:DUF4132 domain-containing protein n=1 Tax=Actinoplanes sp. G11-F43 TaxID=3424130 RepID=UPI003D330731
MSGIPAIIRRNRFVRRGSVDVPPFVIDTDGAAAAEKLLAEHLVAVRQVITAPGTPAPLAEAALAWLDGDPEAPPAGAAAVVAALVIRLGWDRHATDVLIPFADLWIARRGLTFAARAAVEHMPLVCAQSDAGTLHLAVDPPGDRGRSGPSLAILHRVRAALAAEAVDVTDDLLPYRERGLRTAVATSVLLPERRDWVEHDVRAVLAAATPSQDLAVALLCAVSTAAEAEALAPHVTRWWTLPAPRIMATLADGIGPAASGALLIWFDVQHRTADLQKRILAVLVELDGDAAFTGLLDRIDRKYVAAAVLDAAARFPARAMRLFAETGSPLLRAHVLAHPASVDDVAPELSPDAAARVRETTDSPAVEYAPAGSVPPVLASPPWLNRVKAPKPVVVDGLSGDDPATVEWRDGERDRWLSTPGDWGPPWMSWERVAEVVAAGRNDSLAPMLFTGGPDELARPLLPDWRSQQGTLYYGAWVKVAAARFGLDTLPLLLDAADRSAPLTGALLPFSSTAIAVFMADRYSRVKRARPAALAWLLRHPDVAARALVPLAAGPTGPDRRQAEAALLALPVTAVRTAAEGYGPAVVDVVTTLLERDPLTLLPARIPANPAWAAPATLPPVRLRDGSGALPPAAVEALVTMLAISKMDEAYAGVALVAAACEPTDLADFGWELMEAWQRAGADPKQSWVLDALALLGDDGTVRRLTPLILAWPGDGGHTKAVAGVRVLATIGTDVALMRLYGISQRSGFKGLKTAAEEKIVEVADSLGLTAEQLADRLVPDFGLDADGTTTLDYGSRRFRVGFDEQLVPFVTDETGRRLRALPKPSSPEAEEARKRFTTLKKDVRSVAADQMRRLEQAMVNGRRWTPAEFRAYLTGHPLLGHIVRRLIWTVSGDGSSGRSFRVCEDLSLADVADEPYTLPDDATVGVAHPLDLGADLAGWATVLADYEILQPFPQLGRETYPPSDLDRVLRSEVPAGRLLGLERHGWRREAPQDAGVQNRIERVIGDFTVVVELDPGIAVGLPDELGDQKLTEINVYGRSRLDRAHGTHPFGALGPVAASEVIRDLSFGR